jgi:hypothetical protein
MAESERWRHWSVLLWGGVFCTLTVILWMTYPNGRDVTGVYREASQAWWAHQDLYKGPGFHYLPQFAILYSPFQAMPRFVEELLWRWVSVGLIIFAWWKLVTLADPSRKLVIFFGSSVVAMAACGDAFRSGQANTVLAAMGMLAASYLIERRWWPVAISLIVGMAVKPLGLVLALLVLVGYRPMVRPFALSFAIFAIFPFFFGPSDYVIKQFQEAQTHLLNCLVVTDHRFADVNGILRSLGWELSGGINQLVRIGVGGAATLLWMVISRQTGRLPREFMLLALAVSYLMLFNPMTEVNSYVIMAPVYAILGMYLMGTQNGRPYGVIILLGVLSIGILPELVRRVAPRLGLWWDPVATLMCFFALLWYANSGWRKELRLGIIELARDLRLINGRIRA